eukprot:COSAG01_NODE_13579_length_1565_cov_3.012960_3_plen_167_part_00
MGGGASRPQHSTRPLAVTATSSSTVEGIGPPAWAARPTPSATPAASHHWVLAKNERSVFDYWHVVCSGVVVWRSVRPIGPHYRGAFLLSPLAVSSPLQNERPWFGPSYNESVGTGGQEVFFDGDGVPWMVFHAWQRGHAGYGTGGKRTVRFYPLSFLESIAGPLHL